MPDTGEVFACKMYESTQTSTRVTLELAPHDSMFVVFASDARTEGKDFCQTNIAKSLTWQVSWKDTPLLQSGLLGPVTLRRVAERP